MPLFRAGQDIKLTIRGEVLTGKLLYEKSKEIAVRLPEHPVFKNETIWTFIKNETIKGEFTQGSFHCSFDTRLIDLDEDRTTESDWVLNLQLPAKVRRIAG